MEECYRNRDPDTGGDANENNLHAHYKENLYNFDLVVLHFASVVVRL